MWLGRALNNMPAWLLWSLNAVDLLIWLTRWCTLCRNGVEDVFGNVAGTAEDKVRVPPMLCTAHLDFPLWVSAG